MARILAASGLANKDKEMNPAVFRRSLLKWYDTHKRAMPWRAVSGQTPNPYHVWLSEIMLQQTTVQAVIPYFLKFVKTWPSVEKLAKADQQDVLNAWAGLGYYARARNLHKCAQVIAFERGGVFPEEEKELLKLPGVGPYTAAAIRSIAFNKSANVVDGNVERVMARIYAVNEPLPDSKETLKSHAAFLAAGETKRAGDYAQSLMDLGATICTPTSPKCLLCPVSLYCKANAQGNPETYPVKAEKKPKPVRKGYIYWIENKRGEILLHRRPEKGLLGGMIGFPTSEWTEKKAAHHSAFAQVKSLKKLPNAKVKHVFTHFELHLQGAQTRIHTGRIPEDHFWQRLDDFDGKALPTVFRKFYKLLK